LRQLAFDPKNVIEGLDAEISVLQKEIEKK
jgi:hypothetical protein